MSLLNIGVFSLAVTLIIALLSIFVYIKCIIWVPGGHKAILEYGGRRKILEAGIHFVIPVIQKLKVIKWSRIEEYRDSGNKSHTRDVTLETSFIPLHEQKYDLCKTEVVTKDRIVVGVNGVIYFKIVDVEKAVYNIDDIYQALSVVVDVTIRDYTCKINLEDVFEHRNEYAAAVMGNLESNEDDWGIEITRFDIQEIVLSDELERITEENLINDRKSSAKIRSNEIENKLQMAKVEKDAQIQLLREQTANEIAIKKKEYELKMKEISYEEEIKKKEHMNVIQALENKRKEIEDQYINEASAVRHRLEMERADAEYLLKCKYIKQMMEIDGIDQNYFTEEFRYEAAKEWARSNSPMYFPSDFKQLINPYNSDYYSKYNVVND